MRSLCSMCLPCHAWKPEYGIKRGLFLCVSPLTLLGNGSVNTFLRQTNTHATIEEWLDASFLYGPCRIKGMFVCIRLSLLGNRPVNTFPRLRGINRRVVFYAVHILSRGSRQLVVPRTFKMSVYLSKNFSSQFRIPRHLCKSEIYHFGIVIQSLIMQDFPSRIGFFSSGLKNN
jgi:hypothetical protein